MLTTVLVNQAQATPSSAVDPNWKDLHASVARHAEEQAWGGKQYSKCMWTCHTHREIHTDLHIHTHTHTHSHSHTLQIQTLLVIIMDCS